jgi:hypothetical protein
MTTPPPLPSRGELFFDESGETLGPSTTVNSFEATALRKLSSLHLSPDRATCKLAERRIFGDSFNVSLTFVGQRLQTIDLFPNRPGDAQGWSGWTKEKEMARKAWAEEWAARVFGKPLTIKPFVLEELPEPVFPATPGPEHPRHAVFDWGEVCSYFDDKAGFAGLWIRYI